MPAGFSARCRVCTSPHRAKIEEWLAQGLSPRAVAAKLAAELGERIGHVSIWNNQREHWNIGQETARRYAEMTAESQQRLEAEASRRVDEIRALDAGSWVSPAYRGERVPTLEEALEAMRDSGLGLLLEIKEPHLYPGIEARVAAELLHDPYWLEPGRTVVQSFDWASMRTFHAIIPDVPVGLLGKPATRDLPALASYADQINPSHAALTRDYVHRVHEAGMRVFTWTVDDPETMRRLISWGVDGIITNKPDVLREIAADTATARTSVEPDRLPLWSLAESGV